jgi:hypothetical protein
MARILNEAGNQLLDERSYILLDEQPDVNPPTTTHPTVWRATSGLSEFNTRSAYNIVDPSGNFLVDPAGVLIVDTGVTEAITPVTIWQEDDSL